MGNRTKCITPILTKYNKLHVGSIYGGRGPFLKGGGIPPIYWGGIPLAAVYRVKIKEKVHVFLKAYGIWGLRVKYAYCQGTDEAQICFADCAIGAWPRAHRGPWPLARGPWPMAGDPWPMARSWWLVASGRWLVTPYLHPTT